MVIIYYIQIALLNVLITNKYIQTEYSSTFCHFTLSVTFAAYDQFTYFKKINLNDDYTIFYNTPLKDDDIKDNMIITLNNKNVPVQSIEAKTTIPNLSFIFNFFNIGEMKYYQNANEAISFAYKYTNDMWSNQHSLIYQLIRRNIIDEAKFGFVPKDRMEGLLFLGGIPSNITTDKSKAKCKIIKENSFWSCKMDSIFFEYEQKEIEFKNKDWIIQFQSSLQDIRVPSLLFQWFEDKLFKHFYGYENCKIGYYDAHKIFECKTDILEHLPKINFVIDDFVFPVELKELYELSHRKLSHTHRDIILLCEDRELSNKIILGGSFMREYISEFDYLDDYIHFYSDTPFLYRPSFSKDHTTEIIKITILFLIIGMMNIYLSKVKLNNNIYK